MNTRKSYFTRREIYDLVWSKPISTINKELYVTDDSLRKVCKKNNIPLPKSGHWQKVEWKKEFVIDELPIFPEFQSKIKLHKISDFIGYTFNEPENLVVITKEIESDNRLSLTVNEKLQKPHHLIKEFRMPHNNVNQNSGHLDITVSKSNRKRAIRLMDAIIKLLIARGHNIELANHKTYAVVFEEKIKIRLREKSTRVQDPKYRSFSNLEYNGKLVFEIDRRDMNYNLAVINEGSKKLEELLSKILAKLEIQARLAKLERIELENGWAEQARKRKEKEERQAKIDTEMANTKKIFNASKRWQQTVLLTNYIEAVKRNTNKTERDREEFKEWLSWAEEKVDWMNPLIDLDTELLRGIDKDKFLEPPIKKETKWFGY